MKSIKRILVILLAFSMMIISQSCAEKLEISEETTADDTAEITDENIESTTCDTEVSFPVEGLFSVGYARADITPELGCPLGGYRDGGARVSNKLLNELYMTFIAFQDESGARAMLITVDNLGLNNTTAHNMIKVFAKAANVPEENVVMGCTHSHSAPCIDLSGNPTIVRYVALMVKNGKKAAAKAFADLDESEIFIGSKKTEGLTFVRRYLDANGKYVGNNSLQGFAHETEPDTEMQVIKFARKNKKDIILANFQSHPTINGASTDTAVSADYISTFREYAEKNNDIHFAFFQGAAGNLVVKSTLPSEKSGLGSSLKEYGATLDAELKAILSSDMKKISSGKIAGMQKNIKTEVNEWHKNVHDISAEITISAFKIGDAAFIAAPYEMFCQNGLNIKNKSPFEITFICEQANGKNGYFPSSDIFDNGGYEVESTYYVKGTAEAFESGFLDILSQIHQ